MPKLKLPNWTRKDCDLCGANLPMEVCHSAAGYYIGQWCEIDGPYSRLSQEYYSTFAKAKHALDEGNFTMRQHP
jgi:hypothetical protein